MSSFPNALPASPVSEPQAECGYPCQRCPWGGRPGGTFAPAYPFFPFPSIPWPYPYGGTPYPLWWPPAPWLPPAGSLPLPVTLGDADTSAIAGPAFSCQQSGGGIGVAQEGDLSTTAFVSTAALDTPAITQTHALSFPVGS